MTIITKPISEKKEAKLILPLVENEQTPTAPSDDVESLASDPAFIILSTRARRVSTATTLCLLLTALMVVGLGIIAGTHVYRQYVRSQIFKGRCSFPYDISEMSNEFNEDSALKRIGEDFDKQYNSFMHNVFNEEFELDIANEEYEKIDVPDFRDGRTGRFVHDFNANLTGIIDITGKRCFVLPLNRDAVLPPKSLYDLIHKMWDGYYKVNTEVVRETMRVVTPAISDVSEVGSYIAKECNGLPIYRLEKEVKGVWKRSADPETKFAQFSGNGVIEIDINNMEELRQYEKQTH